MAIDPVCKMTVDEETAKITSEYEDTTYYFCAPGCKTAFDENPEKYLGGEAEEAMSHEMPAEPKKAEKKPWWKFW